MEFEYADRCTNTFMCLACGSVQIRSISSLLQRPEDPEELPHVLAGGLRFVTLPSFTICITGSWGVAAYSFQVVS